ncbi:uncharacterized protein J7T54_002399 [Emericellopsis cladophorae]|uniref:Protein FAF1 n=1 Tax=Emericellopsis cladophorae TaxID=2686198 RepID=A0A9Q0BDR5_9HYPO|nr:uncharacterized protein J7T54_002399 [Emericellopsis cladophorae]KAI6782162.1 hypothetical protein J7T54_002399 [Emericellopsis cladophorae]
MAVLGKRKALAPSKEEEIDAEEILRRHFEARFAPLETPTAPAVADTDERTTNEVDESDDDAEQDEDDNAEDEWGGLSDDAIGDSDEDEEDDFEEAVEVVDHSTSQPSKPQTMSKHELRAFMSSKAPSSEPKKQQPPPLTKSKTLPEDAPSLLANDLELRRLLSESHLLAAPKSSSFAEPKPFTSGKVRKKATDMRVQALGSKSSILTQDNVPMAIRKGMNSAREERESKRRREAKENGIILERPQNGKQKERKRDFGGGVDRPGVGRMKGAQLTISDRDIQRVEGSRDVFGRSGKAGGKRR